MLKIFIHNIYLKILLIIFIFSKEMYCDILCQRCCVNKAYIRIQKVFGNAYENGAANGAINNLIEEIRDIRENCNDNEVFSNLENYFITKKNSLPEQSFDVTKNRERLNVANECFIINEVIVILKTCYKNYKSFLEENKNNIFTVENFENYFKIFLELCELMIKESLESYRVVGENEEIKQILLKFGGDNSFKINIKVEKKEYEVKDTIELRNKIGYLFNIFFYNLIKYSLDTIFNDKNIIRKEEEINNIDG